MQGLNFQIDSTYIQSTIPQSDSQTNQENTYSVSFMDMVHNERALSEFNSAEIKSAEFKPDDSKYRNEDSVYKTDTDVTKSSKKETSVNAEKTSANKDVNNKDYSSSDKTDKMDNYESKIKTAEKTDRDTDDSQEKSVVEKIKNSNQFLAELMHSVKNEKFAAKDSVNAENISESNKASLSAQLKLAAQKNGTFDDKEVFVLNEYAKELKERFEDPELLSAQALSVQEPASFIKQVSGEASAKRSDVNVKEIKSKKEVKKFSDVFSVTDLRTEKKAAAVAEKKTDFVTSVKQTASDTVQVTMDLSSQAEKNILSLNGQAAGAQGSTFQAMLENQIAENAGDFVKAGNIVLKDNNVGKINLILHPENLGNVKISLELSDKVVTGKILVTSQEAFNAFNSTQEHLKTAFIESGFDNASFDVAFANQNQNFASSGQNENQNARQAVNAYGELVVENISVDENFSDTLNDVRDYSINIVA